MAGDLYDRNTNGGETHTNLSEFPELFDTNLRSYWDIHEGTDLPSVWDYQVCLKIDATLNKILASYIRIT